ncbi:ATP/GTP-binding protein [Blastococcus mobilis]|uniref:ATP/GTP-binding protein n=1 Tax=Blastococcus mobilis TaxID=1938746 RepID=UPI0020CF4FD5|nr:ATP/GTP-binding protein [Blastococcus mobilis]
MRLALLTVPVFLVASVLSVARADPPVECAKRDAQTGICLVAASSPGQAGGEHPGGSGIDTAAGHESGGARVSSEPCTYQVAEPQPPPTSVVWAGFTPDDGVMYLRVCPRVGGPGIETMYHFVPNGGAPPAGPPVDPRVLAEQVIASMVMGAPGIRLAPPPGSTSGLVGLPVWMWTERGEQLLGPIRQSVSAGGVTVAAVGQVSRIVWDMGDGTTVVCGAGTPYPPGVDGESPDCGHVYARASSRHVAGGGPWPITATSTWTITWSGGGLSGTETLELSSSAELFVGELHVLNQAGGSG